MTVQPILRFPDPRLRIPAEPVRQFDDALRALAADLLDTMRSASGIGIAAPHIGVLQRVVVIQPEPAQAGRTYVNPQIVWSSPEMARHSEGSISMPGITEEIERPARIRVHYQTTDGTPRTEEADGLLSVCLQHEIDQLDGIFWIWRLSRLRRDRVTKRFLKLARQP